MIGSFGTLSSPLSPNDNQVPSGIFILLYVLGVVDLSDIILAP